MIAKGYYLGAAAALTLAFGFTATAADAADVFTLKSDDLPGRQNDAEEGCQQSRQRPDQSELRR